MSTAQHQKFSAKLHGEPLAALGCMEPVCIAYCAAKMREALGAMPDQILVECSGSIVKNAKGAVVPNSDGMKGIDAAAILGAVGGDPALELEVLNPITKEEIKQTRLLLSHGFCRVKLLESSESLHVIVTGYVTEHKALAELKYSHTGIVRVEKDDQLLCG